MLNFVQNFEYYMMFEVVEPNWNLFQTNMESVSNLNLYRSVPPSLHFYTTIKPV